MKKVLIVSDLHCGHLAGLTPPGWQQNDKPGDAPSIQAANSFAKQQRELWSFYRRGVEKHGPFDYLFINGDCIDGKGRRTGGSEAINMKMLDQCEQAVECLEAAITPKRTRVVMVIGTGYHVGEEEDYETLIAKDLRQKHGVEVKIGDHEFPAVEGVVFDLKHHVGSSVVPYGRFTAMARDRLWNQLWADRGQGPKAQVIIRSHVHAYNYCGDHTFLAMTTPALQGWGSKFGARRCSGIVDYGFVVFECQGGDFRFHAEILEGKVLSAHSYTL